jgi:predicted secreted Zn-dependent protease
MLPKILLLILPLFLALPNEDNIIDWSPSRKLTWADFKGKPDPASSNAALTNSSITLSSEYSNKQIKYVVSCKFNKLLSWGRIRNDYILKHEQGHFDIAEAHARLLYKNLSDYKFNSKSANDDVNRIYSETMKEHVSMQKAYDLESDHSLDSTQQLLWNRKIDSMLTGLAKYANYK